MNAGYHENYTDAVCVGKIQFHNVRAGGTTALYCHAIALLVVTLTYGMNTHSEGNRAVV
jgi:hypothetical protein